MKKIASCIIIILFSIIAYNAISLNAFAVWKISSDERNDNVRFVIYHRWLLQTDTLVFDIWKINPSASMVDVDRILFQVADALESNSYNSVILAYRGEVKFSLSGDYFQYIGAVWPNENPLPLVLNLTEHITSLDGMPSFGKWSGGWLGVMSQRMKDHNKLHERWYIDDIIDVQAQ